MLRQNWCVFSNKNREVTLKLPICVLRFLFLYKCIYKCKSQFFIQRTFNCVEPVMEYTDDSAMTRSLAESLIEKQDLDIVDVAKRFAKSYHEKPDRGYGAGTAIVSS